MAENENRNNVNPTITINNGGAGLPQGESAVLPILVEFIRQSGLNHQEIKDLLSNISNVPANADFASLSDDVKKSLSKSINAAKNAILKKIEGLSVAPAESGVDNSAEIAKLEESLARVEKMVGDGLKASNTAERATARELKKLVGRLDSLDKKLDELLARGLVGPGATPEKPGETPEKPGETPAAPGGTPAKPGETPAAPGGTPAKPGETPEKPGEKPATPGGTPAKPGETPAKPGEKPATPGGTPAKPGETPEKPGEKPAVPGGKPVPPAQPSKPKLKKLRFVQKSLQQTKMLAEAKQPWYKRLATFAIKHPVLSVVAGAGLGLGLFGATCGIAALAGGTGFLTAANMLLPSLPAPTGTPTPGRPLMTATC